MIRCMMAVLFLTLPALGAPKIGSKAPDFSLKGHDGKVYSLKDLKGKYVVLEWFNNECPYVDKHYHKKYSNMQKLQQSWQEKAKAQNKELVWLAVVSSAEGKQGYVTPKEAKKIRDEERKAHMTAIVMDPTGVVGKAYGATKTPHMYIIDDQSVLQFAGGIDDKKSARVETIPGAKNYVSSALSELFKGKPVSMASPEPYGCSVKY